MLTTANYTALNFNLQLLPEQVQNQVFDYVQFLLLKYYTAPQQPENKEIATDKPTYRTLGTFKGKIWMSDDFNEPLEDFKDY